MPFLHLPRITQKIATRAPSPTLTGGSASLKATDFAGTSCTRTKLAGKPALISNLGSRHCSLGLEMLRSGACLRAVRELLRKTIQF